ncbi:MAG: hypothetical protein HY795_15175 [Desulfovibrio sp.]|nr:hypothetical protein [Desulfovibrio sp.]MBI4960634.1 hypothetical protein [Desulfovibrio sp.]
MFGFKPPLKFMIVKSLLDSKGKNAKEIHDHLKHDYGAEKQLSIESVENHLQTLKTVGVVKVVSVNRGEDEELVIQYSITKNGRALISKSLL